MPPTRRSSVVAKKEDSDGNVEGKQSSTTATDKQISASNGSSDTSNDDDFQGVGLSSYEAQRLENIQRNQEMLAKLGVQQAALNLESDLKPLRSSSDRPVKKARKLSREVLPRRSSTRIQGQEAPDYTAARVEANEAYLIEQQPKQSRIALIHGKRFFEDISTNEKLKGCVSKKVLEYANKLADMTTNKHSIHKILDNRISALALLECDDAVVVAGDKTGCVAVLRVSNIGKGGGKDHEISHSFKYMNDTVTAIKTTSHVAYSACYNGQIIAHDLDHYTTRSIVYQRNDGSYDDNRVYTFDFDSPLKQTGFVGHGDGIIKRFDIRTTQTAKPYTVHDKKVSFLDFNPSNPNYLATASLDRSIKIWDVRKLGSEGCNLNIIEDANLSINHCTWSPDGKKLLSASQDHHVRIHYNPQGGGSCPTVTIPHFNKTGRWLTKFAGVWDPKNTNVFYYGSMQQPRQIEAYVFVDDAVPTHSSVDTSSEQVKQEQVKTEAKKGQKGEESKAKAKKGEEDEDGDDGLEEEELRKADDFFPAMTEKKLAPGGAKQMGCFRLMQFQDEDYLGSVQSLLAPHHKKFFLAGANSSGRISFFQSA